MDTKTLDTYLNDHLAGAMLGTELAAHVRDHGHGAALAEAMVTIAAQVEADREVLVDLVERMGTTRSPVKQATGWFAEKASRAKFSGLTAGDAELGTFMALEALVLGVTGKLALWVALKEVQGDHAELRTTDLDGLIRGAEGQRATLEAERRRLAREVLGRERVAQRA